MLIIFATIVLIACGFFAYLWFQPAVTTTTSRSNSGNATETTAPASELAPASRPVETPDPERVGGAGVSENIYIKVPDEKTGALSTEFRAKRFEPRKDGTVDVTEPEATFYLGAKTNTDGQKLVIRGKSGKVAVPDSANKRSQMRPG